MRKIAAGIMLLLGFCVLLPSISSAQPSEEGLIKAWEEVQKNDPQTAIFEKLENRRYKFETEIFPFDGELKVLNVVVDDSNADMEYGYTAGTIELELVGLAKDFMEKYFSSYSVWRRNVLSFRSNIGKVYGCGRT